MTIREIKEYAREQLRYSLQNDNVYIDGYVYAAIFGFNQFNGRLDNSHNNIHVSKGEQFIYLMLRSREDQGVSLTLNLIKMDTAVPEREFHVPVDAQDHLLLAQLRYPWGFRCFLQPDHVAARLMLPSFDMRFNNPFLQFRIQPMPKEFTIQVFKNNIELIQLENRTSFDLIELLILNAGYVSVEEFVHR